jgi:hypothetical protein
MSYKNVVYEWNSICNHLGEKVAEEPMTGFAGEYEEGDDWSDDDIAEEELQKEFFEAEMQPMYDDCEEEELDWYGEVEDQLRELTDIPYFLYKECREEGMSKKEAIEETRNRFWEK